MDSISLARSLKAEAVSASSKVDFEGSFALALSVLEYTSLIHKIVGKEQPTKSQKELSPIPAIQDPNPSSPSTTISFDENGSDEQQGGQRPPG